MNGFCFRLAGVFLTVFGLFSILSADTWLFGGQSNMECRRIVPAFEKELLRVRPDMDLVTDCVQKNGSSMSSHWLPGKDMYNRFIPVIEDAGSDLKGIVWYQGESESGAESRAAFLDNMETFFKALRTAVGNDNLPIIIVQLSNTGSESDEIAWAVLREFQRQLSQDPRNRLVTAVDGLRYTRDGCPYRCDPDGYDVHHLIRESREAIGIRAAREALDMVYQEDVPLPPLLDKVSIDAGDPLLVRIAFTRAPNGVTPGTGNSEIAILSGVSFEQWVDDTSQTLRLSHFTVETALPEILDDTTIGVRLNSPANGPLLCSYANTAGGMETILPNLGITHDSSLAATFLVDIQNSTSVIAVYRHAPRSLNYTRPHARGITITGRVLQGGSQPVAAMPVLDIPDGRGHAEIRLLLPNVYQGQLSNHREKR